MQPIDSVTAVRVLGAVRHRGVREWRFDPECQRVIPERWTERDTMPAFTVFECMALARRLVEIGAVRR